MPLPRHWQDADRTWHMGQLRPHGPIWTPFDVAYKHAKEVSKFWRQDAVEPTEHPEEVAPAFIFLASE